MDRTNKKTNSFWRRTTNFLLEVVIELAAVAIFLLIGAGILALFGAWDALKTLDTELMVFIGALVALAIFGIVIAIIAINRRNKEKNS